MSWRTTIVMAAAFVCTTTLWLSTRPEKGRFEGPKPLFAESEDQFAKIEIQPIGATEIILERRAESRGGVVWWITKPIERPANVPFVKEMILGLRELRDDGLVPNGDKEQAGVQPAELVVHVHVGGAKRTIRFGRQVKKDPANRWFLYEDKLYIGTGLAFEPFTRSLAEYRHRRVLFFDRFRVTRIQFEEHYPKAGTPPTEGYDVSEFVQEENPSLQRGWYWTKFNGEERRERVNEVRVNALIGESAGLEAEDFIESSEPAKYGLDKPRVRLRLWAKDVEKPIELAFGREDKIGDKHVIYVQAAGTTEVAVVPRDRLLHMPLGRNALRSTGVYDFERDEVQWVQIDAFAHGMIRLVRTEEVVQGNKVEKWIVKHPDGFKPQEEDLEIFVNALFTLRVKEDGFMGPQDLKTFGLDPPGIVMTLQLKRRSGKDERVELRFGRQGPTGDTYMLREKSPEIFAADPIVYEKLDRLELNFRRALIFDCPLTGIRAVNSYLKHETELGKAHYINIEVGADREAVDRDTSDPRPLDKGKVRELLSALNYIEVDAFISRRTEELKKYGLESLNTAGKLEITVEDANGARRTAVIRISGPYKEQGTDASLRYGVIEGDPVIFRVKPRLIETLKKGVK